MENVGARKHRIWSHAALGGAAMMLIPILIASIQWQLGIDRDSDMSNVVELIFTLAMILTMPAFALAFCILAPSAVALDRLTRGRTSQLANMLLGVFLSLPLFVAFILGSTLFRWSQGLPFTATLIRGLFIPQRHP